MADGKVLSQSEIDAILAAAPKDNGAAAKSPSQPTPLKVFKAEDDSLSVKDMPRADMMGYEEQPGQIEEIMKRLEQLERKIEKLSVSLEQSRNAPPPVSQIKEIERRLAEISENLSNTPVYGIRKGFECSSCHSRGTIAVPLRCTKCGKETHIGWWPK